MAIPPPNSLREEVSQHFYRRLLDQCSQRIFNLAEQLPGFSRQTAAQLLQEHQQTQRLLAEIKDAINHLTYMYQTSHLHNTSQAAASFEQAYRTLLPKS